MRHSNVTCLFLVGCRTDFTGYGDDVSTMAPTIEQVNFCRDVMYVNPQLDIEPLGYYMQPGMNDVSRFKFNTKTGDRSCY